MWTTSSSFRGSLEQVLKNVPDYGLRKEKVSEQLLRVLLPSLTCCVSGGGCGQSIDGVGENNAAT